jgi:flagellin
MAMVINSNIMSLTSQRALSGSNNDIATAMERLSTGLRINSAKDDAAGLAISERFTAQIRGINQAARNANDGISLAQTAEGDLQQVTNNLQRIRELAVQSANATNSASDRAALQAEVAQLVEEIDRVAVQSNFNGVSLLDGTFSAQTFQVGANAGQTITVDSIASARSSALGQFQGFQLSSQSIGTASDTAAAQSVTIDGNTTSLGTIANDAKALAAAFNSANLGFLASANETSVAAGTSNATAGDINNADSFSINGTTINLTNSGNAATNRDLAVDAINAQSSVTGVVATNTGSGVSLSAQDGRNITVADGTLTSTNGLAEYGLAAAATTGATIDLTYQAPSGISGSVTFTGAFDPGAQTIGGTGTALSAVDISDVQGANTALAAVDAALTTINGTRADLGAVQNRFESVVVSLQTSAENLTAARSRIQDADFAAETANLTRSQILQQAGVAMLSQANAQPQTVLALLQ